MSKNTTQPQPSSDRVVCPECKNTAPAPVKLPGATLEPWVYCQRNHVAPVPMRPAGVESMTAA